MMLSMLAIVAVSAPLQVGDDLQVLWDDLVVDTERTTARRVLHHPEYAGVVFDHDVPWEGDACGYHTLFKDGDIYRMYYNSAALCWAEPRKPVGFRPSGIRICYAESKDGVHWMRPELGICEFNGSRKNNIIMDKDRHFALDNFYVFKDANPGCPADELYKAVTQYRVRLRPGESAPPNMIFTEYDQDGHKDPEHPFAYGLWFFFSSDGLHFRPGRAMRLSW